jgi:hypothetical protein
MMAPLETPCSATSSISFDTPSSTSTAASLTVACATSQSTARRADSWTSMLVSRNSTNASLASESTPWAGATGAVTRATGG